MSKNLYSFIIFSLTVLLALSLFGCKNPDSPDPVVPDPDPNGSPGIDPPIPEPFAGVDFGQIIDIAIEGDGDIVISDLANGLLLFTPYGVPKRVMGDAFLGLVTSNYGNLDTGRGVMGLSPDTCTPAPAYDDAYVTGGVPHVAYDMNWYGGEPDPYYPDIPIDIASSSGFTSCSCFSAITLTPDPIAYHPLTRFAYQKVYTPDCVADSDVEWPLTNTIPVEDYAILAYHPDAPLPPDYMSLIFEGGQDYLVYYDFPTYMALQNAASFYGVVPACTISSLFIVWDLTDMNYMSSRNGMTTSNICDFEFDSLNRLIAVMPNADSVIITDPVVFGEPIIVQRTIGGRQNGMGTLPGEFQGPHAVAIDPRNQNILVSDAGNGRVQIFDNDGNFIREFGAADASFTPGAIRVDAFGAIYVVNTQTGGLRIYNEYGSPVIYGTLEGWVYNKETGLPLDNAMVRAQSTFMPLDEFTDKDGHFKFDAIAAGTHNIVAEKYGFESSQVNVTVTGGQKTLVDIYLKQTMIGPAGYGTITGTVFSSLYNEPVPGLTAEVVGAGVSNQTNGNGEFALYQVPEGDHTLRLTVNGTVWYEKYVTVTKGGILDMGVIYLPIP